MHDERRVAGQRLVAALFVIRLVVGRLAAREVGDVVARPLALRRILPH